ncbi:hypothetical protein [Chitinophaga sp. HK235]|uniref:DUF6896 domain-containing protein n=1 Tax=Chitinophaga sp. HK235 TaxID=2952571 RepID=UPI001BA4A796|nr:hypothetical protein [Chitinophaga sp. HK235]
MERITEIVTIHLEEQLPSLEYIRAIPRIKELKLIFEGSMQSQREQIGKVWKDSLQECSVAIYTSDPIIGILPLITDREIEEHQDFFEQCALDYRTLSELLVFELGRKLAISIDRKYPWESFGKKLGSRGVMGNWSYFLHGFHCGFEHKQTGQLIEAPLVFNDEFGDLDPYFFSRYIRSTPAYQPLPVVIFEDCLDGVRILDKMVSLGKFERISSNWPGHHGTVAVRKERQLIDISEAADKPTGNWWHRLKTSLSRLSNDR